MKTILIKIFSVLSCPIIFLASCNQSTQKEKVSSGLTPDSITVNTSIPATPQYAEPLMSEGTDFYASGNPSWTLEMDLDKSIHFRSADSVDITTSMVKGTNTKERNTTRYQTRAGKNELVIEILKNECVTEGTGEKSDFFVTIRTKNSTDTGFKTYTGCGRYVSYHGLNDFWVLEGINNTIFNPSDFTGGMPYIQLNTSTKKISGYAGCNGMNGGFAIKGKNIKFDKISTSKAMCPNQEIENKFLKYFSGNEVAYELKAARLFLHATPDSVFVYRRIQ